MIFFSSLNEKNVILANTWRSKQPNQVNNKLANFNFAPTDKKMPPNITLAPTQSHINQHQTTSYKIPARPIKCQHSLTQYEHINVKNIE